MFHNLKEAMGKGNCRQMVIVAPQHATVDGGCARCGLGSLFGSKTPQTSLKSLSVPHFVSSVTQLQLAAEGPVKVALAVCSMPLSP